MQLRTLHIPELSQVAIYHQPTAQLYFYDEDELELIDSLTITTSCPSLMNVYGDYMINVLHHGCTFQIYQLSTRKLIHHHQLEWSINCVEFNKNGLFIGGDNKLISVDYHQLDHIQYTSLDCASISDIIVENICAAPCGGGVIAITDHNKVYITKQISHQHEIQQYEIQHEITCNGRIDAVAWHFSSIDSTRQSLAVLVKNKVMVWNVNVGRLVKKIRDVPVKSHKQLKFLKWCKGGQVVCVSAAAENDDDENKSTNSPSLTLIDVKTKNVSTKHIPVRSLVNLDLHSSSSKCWTVADDELKLYSLSNGCLQESVKLPECATICESSPVVRLTKYKPNQITIKKSPKRYNMQNLFKPQYYDSNFDFSASTSYSSSGGDSGESSSGEYSPIFTPTRGFSVDSVSTLDSNYTCINGTPPLSHSAATKKSHHHHHHHVENSLFPEILSRLLCEPKAVTPLDDPLTSQESYVIKSIFDTFNINDAINNQLNKSHSSFNTQLKAIVTGEYKYESTPGIHDSGMIHHTAAMHCIFKQFDLAKETYVRRGHFLEALVVSLIHNLDWITVLNQWIRNSSGNEKTTLVAIKSQIWNTCNNNSNVPTRKLSALAASNFVGNSKVMNFSRPSLPY